MSTTFLTDLLKTFLSLFPSSYEAFHEIARLRLTLVSCFSRNTDCYWYNNVVHKIKQPLYILMNAPKYVHAYVLPFFRQDSVTVISRLSYCTREVILNDMADRLSQYPFITKCGCIITGLISLLYLEDSVFNVVSDGTVKLILRRLGVI